MLRLRSSLFAVALTGLIVVAGCSDDDEPAGPGDDPIAALVGSYQTQSFRYTAVANPDLTVDLAALGAGVTALTVSADGSFQGQATLEIDGDLVSIDANGTLTNVTATSLTLNFEGVAAQVLPNPLPVSYTVTGNVVSFTATNVNFDYSVVGGPPGDTPSTLEVVLLRS